MILTSISCDGVSDATGIDETPRQPSPKTEIIQIADTIRGKQAADTLFAVNDYFQSETPIISAAFDSSAVVIKEISEGLFRVSQPDTLTGAQILSLTLTNSDFQSLKAQLVYIIEADTSLNNEHPEPEPEPELSTDAAKLVIMPLGDSMTNDSRSRVALWNLLSTDGHELDFVGDQYQESSIPDPDHEGVGGIKIHQISEKITPLLQKHKPDYVNLMVGTNDIAWYFDDTATDIAARWNSLIQKIFDHSAEDTWIIAATIPPVFPKNVGKSGLEIRDRAEMVTLFNTRLRTIVQERRAAGERIVLADMEKALGAEHLSGDGVHLTGAGYAIMGEVYYKAISSTLE